MQFKIPPLSHHLAVLKQCEKKHQFALLWEMGCMKTSGTINILRQVYTAKGGVLPTLIICPGSVRRNWEREFNAHAGLAVSRAVRVIDGDTTPKKLKQIREGQLGGRIWILNTESLQQASWKDVRAALGVLRCVVVDESHKFKNPNSKRTKALFRLRDESSVDYRYILSGSPQLKGPEDYWAQFMFLNDKLFPKRFWNFQEKYFEDKNESWKGKKNYFPKWEPREESAAEIAKIISPYCDRKRKEDILDLPPLVRTQILVEPTKEQAKAMDELAATFIAEFGDSRIVTSLGITKALRLAQLACGVAVVGDAGHYETKLIAQNKTSALIEQLDVIEPSKAVVWCHWRDFIPVIEEALEDAGIPFVTVTGDTTSDAREKSLQEFRKKKSCRVFLATQAAAGTGVDGLQVANYEFYLAKTHNLEHDLQSESRIHRGGSEVHEHVTRVDIDLRGSIEEDITNCLRNKSSEAEFFYATIRRLKGEDQYGIAAD